MSPNILNKIKECFIFIVKLYFFVCFYDNNIFFLKKFKILFSIQLIESKLSHDELFLFFIQRLKILLIYTNIFQLYDFIVVLIICINFIFQHISFFIFQLSFAPYDYFIRTQDNHIIVITSECFFNLLIIFNAQYL